MTPATRKALIIGGVLAAFGFAMTMGGDANASGGGGTVWDREVRMPETADEIAAAKTQICLCYRGLDFDAYPTVEARIREITLCALEQVYQEVPWREIVDPIHPDTHPSVRDVLALFVDWTAVLASLPDEKAREEWCSGKSSGGGASLQPAPVPKPKQGSLGQLPVDDPAKRKKRLDELLGPPVPGGFYLTYFKDPVGLGGQSGFARAQLKAVGITSPDPQLVVRLMQANGASEWNRRPYARNAEPKEYHAYLGKVVDPVFRPVHEDAVQAVVDGYFPRRNINDAGKAVGGFGSSYGLMWGVGFDVDKARIGVLDVTKPEPPEDFTELLEER